MGPVDGTRGSHESRPTQIVNERSGLTEGSIKVFSSGPAGRNVQQESELLFINLFVILFLQWFLSNDFFFLPHTTILRVNID